MTHRSLQAEKTGTVLSSLNGAMHLLMSNDNRMIVIGEDIADPYGGAFKVTRGLSTCYPQRVFTTPISESAIVGIATGLALRGFRPVAEIMFGDFLTLAADQLINHAAKFNWMYNGTASVPLVVRTPMGGRRGYGPTHSQSLEKHFLGVPGLLVAAVSHVVNAGELLSIAVRAASSPVLFIENKQLYPLEQIEGIQGWEREVFDGGSAVFPTVIYRQGFSEMSDAMLFCYGGMTPLCIDAISALHEREGLNCDLAVFSQLSPTPSQHVLALVKRGLPPVCAFAEEAWSESGWASEMIASIEETRGRNGDARPVRHVRVGASATPIGACRALERTTLPQTKDLIGAIVDCF